MKILYITDININEKTAGAIHVKKIVDNFIKLNNQVDLIYHDSKTNIESGISKLLSKLFFNLYLIFAIIFIILKNNPDVIYTRQGISLISPAIMSKILFKPYFTEINGVTEEDLKTSKANLLVIKMSNIVESICYNFSKDIIAVNENIKNYIIEKYKIIPEKITVIDNGIDKGIFIQEETKKARKKLSFPDGYFYIVYTGGLMKWYGLEYLIKSADYIKEDIPQFKIIIVGDGPEKDNLIKLTKELNLSKYIIFIGAVNHKEVPDYINSSDICISYLTRLKEGKYGPPFKVYEYLSCNKPVILSKIKDFEKTYKDILIMAEPEDEKDLAKKIVFLLKNKKIQKDLSKKAKKFISNIDSWEDVARKTIELFS